VTPVSARGRLVGLSLAAAVIVVAGWYLVTEDLPASDDLAVPALLTGIAMVIVIPGLVAEWRRPRDHVAWLVVTVGLAAVVADFRLLRSPSVALVGAAAFYAFPLIACDLVLRMPDGLAPRLRPRVVALYWVVPSVLGASVLLVTGPRRSAPGLWSGGLRAASWAFMFAPTGAVRRWSRQGNVLHLFTSGVASWALWAVWSLVVVIVAWTTAVLVARRSARGSPAERRTARLLRAAAIAVAVGATVQALGAFPERVRVIRGVPVGSVLQGHWYTDLVNVAPAIGAAVLGAVLLWSELVRPRLGRSGRAIQLDLTASPTVLGQRLQRALGDPTARVLFPRDAAAWVDDRGQPAEPAARPGRAATIVTREGITIAAIEHDAWLLAQPDLVDVAVASVALTLEARRLTALTRASTEDIQASATRLLQAADRARRQVEHRIETGPEQTLATVGALLNSDPVMIGEVHRGLRTAVAQVRAIAHGLAPSGFADGGLPVALDDLAATSDAPLTVEELPTTPLPASVGMTVFLLVQDAVHHADGRLRVACSLESGADQTGAVVVRVDGWGGPVEQLLDDRIHTLGGAVIASGDAVRVTLPVDTE
jgi:hypothetical protein